MRKPLIIGIGLLVSFSLLSSACQKSLSLPVSPCKIDVPFSTPSMTSSPTTTFSPIATNTPSSVPTGSVSLVSPTSTPKPAGSPTPTWTPDVQPCWRFVGNSGFASGRILFPSLALFQDNPYLAFADYSNGAKMTVMAFNGTAWSVLGNPGFSAGQVFEPRLLIDNGQPFVAFTDVSNNHKASVMKYDGNQWTYVGGVSASDDRVTDLSLFIDNGTIYLAFEDIAFCNKATVMKFDGTSWVVVGTRAFTSGNVGDLSLFVRNGTPSVSFTDTSHPLKTFLQFDGTSWVSLEDTDSLACTTTFKYMCRYNSDDNAVRVLRHDGTSWVTLGGTVFEGSVTTEPSLSTETGTPTVAYEDFSNGSKITVKKFTGSDWVAVGNPDFTPSSAGNLSLQVAGDGTPFVGFEDGSASGNASVMKYE